MPRHFGCFPKMLIFVITTLSSTTYAIKAIKQWILNNLNVLLKIYRKQLSIRLQSSKKFKAKLKQTPEPELLKFINFKVPRYQQRKEYEIITKDAVLKAREIMDERFDRQRLNELKSEIRSLKGILLTRRNLI